MKALRISSVATLIFLLQSEAIRSSASVEEVEDSKESRQKQRSPGEAEEDAVFAAAVLGLVHDRVRDVGNLFRVIGDTAGGLAGGGIKVVGATVNGLSSALDVVSQTVEPTPKVVGDESSPPSASKDEFSETNGYHDPVTRRDNEHAEGPTTKTHPANQGQDASGSPDPFDRVATVARTSLAGSLKLISTAVRGVGDAVFQAGTVVEELTGGTGQVAEDVVRVVQGAVGWARDDMLRFSERDDPMEGRQDDMWPPSTPGTKAGLPSKSRSSGGSENTKSIANTLESGMPDAGDDAYVDSWIVSKLWRRAYVLAHAALEIALRELAGLFRRRNGAPPPALRLGVIFMLVFLIMGRRRRRDRQHLPHDHDQQQQPLRPVETAEPFTPRQSNTVVAPDPTPTSAVAAALTSPSRSLFSGSRWPRYLPVRAVSGLQQPSFESDLGTFDDLDRVLHSPAQVRAPFRARVIRSTVPTVGSHEESGVEDAEEVMAGRNGSERGLTRGLWDWRRCLRWMGFCKSREGGVGGSGRGGGSRRRWIWIVLLWFAASVLEERERDRVAWLAWDEGFREGEAFRVADPSASIAESTAWFNHLIGNMWNGHPLGQHESQSNVNGQEGDTGSEGVPKGLRAFVSRNVAASITEVLEEFNSKLTSVVRIELQEVDLGSSPPQVLGIKVLDAMMPTTPGYGDGKCTLATNCLALQIDLEVATRGLRVSFGVKPSTRGDKAVLPLGTVRLLQLYLKGRLSVRVELTEEFPFVGMALIAFDGDPDVQVRVEQWGLDALTLGAVDEWARVGVKSALKPFLLPGYLEMDAALVLCPNCPATTPVPVNESSRLRKEPKDAGPNTKSIIPSTRPSAVAAAASRRGSNTLGREAIERQGSLNKNMGWEWDNRKLGECRSDSLSSGANDKKRSSRDIGQVPCFLSPSVARTVVTKELHEERRSLGGTLEWIKDRLLSDSAEEASGKREESEPYRGAMK